MKLKNAKDGDEKASTLAKGILLATALLNLIRAVIDLIKILSG